MAICTFSAYVYPPTPALAAAGATPRSPSCACSIVPYGMARRFPANAFARFSCHAAAVARGGSLLRPFRARLAATTIETTVHVQHCENCVNTSVFTGGGHKNTVNTVIFATRSQKNIVNTVALDFRGANNICIYGVFLLRVCQKNENTTYVTVLGPNKLRQ